MTDNILQLIRRSFRSKLKPFLHRHRRLLLTICVAAATVWFVTRTTPAVGRSTDSIRRPNRLSSRHRTPTDAAVEFKQNSANRSTARQLDLSRQSLPSNSTWINDVTFPPQLPLFTDKPLVIWSSNFHPSPVVDIKQLLEPLGVRFVVKDLSAKYCEHFNTCSTVGQGQGQGAEQQSPLKVINRDNILAMTHPEELIPAFYAAYHNDTEMRSVDAFLCCDPPGACELFEPFKKSIIIVATTRYNIGRSNAPRWAELNKKFQQLAAQPQNVIAANNQYDQEYIRYFTGINAQLLPSTCDYTATTYRPSRPGYLLAVRPRDPQKFQKWFLGEFNSACSGAGLKCATTLTSESNSGSEAGVVRLNPIRQLYGNYRYTDLAAHRGIVHLPYQASVMAVLEQYRMNIPLFFPSKKLLVRWHLERFVLHERCESPPPWPVHWVRRPRRRSNVRSHPSQRHRPDPNNDRDEKAVDYWLQFADYYALPHIVYFDTVEHLARLLNSTTNDQLNGISRKMAAHNKQLRHDVLEKWRSNLRTVAKYSSNKPH